MPAFATATQLATHLQQNVDTATATQALDGASGLLRSAAGITVDPSPVPLDLRTWTLELAGLIYENPTGREREEVGDIATSWLSVRRRQILAEAARVYGVAPGPVFSFPDAPYWPAS